MDLLRIWYTKKVFYEEGEKMENLSNIGTLKRILKNHGFNFSKALGQNFLVNPSVCPKMVEQSGINETVGVLEIGPGMGTLTQELAKKAKKVIAIEVDKRLLPILNENLSEFDNLKVINCDILKIDLKKLFAEEFLGMDVAVCANLPYYITSQILMKLLEEKLSLKSITVMVQKEVAQRICSGAANKNASSISLAVNYYAEPEILFEVKKGSFWPIPKVDSAVIKLNIREKPACNVVDEKKFFKIIKSAFLQRRKTIINSLSNNLNLSKDIILYAFNSLKIDPQNRAENLTLEQFSELTEALSKFIVM